MLELVYEHVESRRHSRLHGDATKIWGLHKSTRSARCRIGAGRARRHVSTETVVVYMLSEHWEDCAWWNWVLFWKYCLMSFYLKPSLVSSENAVHVKQDSESQQCKLLRCCNDKPTERLLRLESIFGLNEPPPPWKVVAFSLFNHSQPTYPPVYKSIFRWHLCIATPICWFSKSSVHLDNSGHHCCYVSSLVLAHSLPDSSISPPPRCLLDRLLFRGETTVWYHDARRFSQLSEVDLVKVM